MFTVCFRKKCFDHLLKIKVDELVLLLCCPVTGCANQKLPTDAYWMRGNDMVLTVGCRSNSRSWQLVCRGNDWHGSYGNCSTDGQLWSA